MKIEYETIEELACKINALSPAQRVELNTRLAGARLADLRSQGWKKWLVAAGTAAVSALATFCLTSCTPAGIAHLRLLDAYLHAAAHIETPYK